jgi:hypothetical protein
VHAVPGVTLAGAALDQLPDLQAGVSLAEWKSAHASDTVTPYHPPLSEPTNRVWCARAVAETTAETGQKMTRAAYFYPPAAPDVFGLPTETPAQLVDACKLGFVWVETADTDRQRAATVAGETNQALSAGLGAGDTTAKLNWWNAASWRRTARWMQVDVTIALASTDKPAWGPAPGVAPAVAPATTPTVITPTRVFIAAAAPISGITFGKSSDVSGAPEAFLARHRLAASRIEEAMTIAAQEDAVERPMRSFLAIFEENPGSPRLLTATERTAFADALDRWLTFPPELPSMRRVAALVAADLLLEESFGSAGWRDNNQTALRRRFEARGASFANDHLGNCFVFTHSWLKQAERINAGGRAGELAFLTLIGMGFETSGMCQDQHGEGFRAVISRGEEYLRTNPNATIRTEIHFLIGKAYADIVRLADGGGGDYADAAKYAPEAAQARTRALEEFRLAFQADPSSSQARDVWPAAWRLSAGLSPAAAFFFCVYD